MTLGDAWLKIFCVYLRPLICHINIVHPLRPFVFQWYILNIQDPKFANFTTQSELTYICIQYCQSQAIFIVLFHLCMTARQVLIRFIHILLNTVEAFQDG